MQPSKSSQQQANNTDPSSSQPNSDASDIFQGLFQEGYQYGFFYPFGVPSLGTDFSACDGTQSSREISLSLQTETDYQEYELAATTSEQPTSHDDQRRPLAPVSNSNPSEPIELLSNPGVWEASLSSYNEAFRELILPAGLTDTEDPLLALAIETPSVAEERRHDHGDLPCPRANSVDGEGMTNWRRQAQEPFFRVNVPSPSSSQSEEPPSSRHRQSSSEQESRDPKRQCSSRAGLSSSPSCLGASRFRQNRGGMNDNQPISRSQLQIRTAPEATPVGDLLQVITQGQNPRTRKRRSSISFPCPECPLTFTRKRDITRHKKTIHTEKKIKYTCEFCNKSYTRDDSRKRHYPNCPKKPEDT
ncbi:hypothetical protein BJV82DRAFT_392788 [Fennellomyces sp. T-0311]|nr:hypothetical protein BJV82DRAFT_392788 [Fennellomyces sp. T-0311]